MIWSVRAPTSFTSAHWQLRTERQGLPVRGLLATPHAVPARRFEALAWSLQHLCRAQLPARLAAAGARARGRRRRLASSGAVIWCLICDGAANTAFAEPVRRRRRPLPSPPL